MAEIKKNKEEKMPVEWICVTTCYCSTDDNPLGARLWQVGESYWGVDAPSKHFIPAADYNAGADGRAIYFKKIKRYGGNITPQVKALEVNALKALCTQLEREYMRKQASR